MKVNVGITVDLSDGKGFWLNAGTLFRASQGYGTCPSCKRASLRRLATLANRVRFACRGCATTFTGPAVADASDRTPTG
jgi:ribosomal protein L37AE/L43A